MNEFISNMFSVIFTSPFTIPIVAIIAVFWHKTAKDKSDNQLKQSMLERGMTAEDIEQVMNAGNQKEKRK